MHLEGIGDLTDLGTHWRLVYTNCGHIQQLARLGLESSELAEREVRRYYAECRTCQLERRLAERERNLAGRRRPPGSAAITDLDLEEPDPDSSEPEPPKGPGSWYGPEALIDNITQPSDTDRTGTNHKPR